MVTIERISNGGFEISNGHTQPIANGWTCTFNNTSPYTVTGGYQRTGTYCARLFRNSYYNSTCEMHQTIDLTGVNYISFWWNTDMTYDAGNETHIDVLIDDTIVHTIDSACVTTYANVLINVISYTGSHTVKFNIRRPNGNSSVIDIDDVSATATFLANFTCKTTIHAGLPYTFTNTSSGLVSSLWDFGDGTTSTDTNPTKTFTTPGTYTVSLKINGGTTGDYLKTTTITVNPMPHNLIIKRGTTTLWSSQTLNYGELGYNKDTKELRIGTADAQAFASAFLLNKNSFVIKKTDTTTVTISW